MPIAIDFETFYSKKQKYGVRTMHPEEYCADERFDAYMVSVCDGPNAWSGHPKDLNWKALEGKDLISHNAAFDHTVYNELLKRQLVPNLRPASWHCTANMTSYLCNRRALDNAVEYLFKTKVEKQVRADANNKRWPDDFKPEERAAMLEYAKQDAIWCHRLWTQHSDRWPSVERQLSDLTIRQSMRGVQINTELLGEYLLQAHEARSACEKVIPWIKDADDDDESWDDFNTRPTSSKCISEQCRRVGIPPAPLKKDAEAYEEWATKYSKQHEWIRALEAWRSINKLFQTFNKMRGWIRADGTMPISLLYFGAHTGRWSSKLINFQNLRKYPVIVRQDGLVELNEKLVFAAVKEKEQSGNYPSWVRHAIDFRALIVPRPNRKMILCDLSAIEPRVLAYLSGNTEMLGLMAGGMNIYEAFNRASFGYAGPKMDKASMDYKLCKIQTLQLGYGAGPDKFIVTAMKESGIDLTEGDPEFITETDAFTGEETQMPGRGAFAKKLVADFRTKNPKITALWQKLDEAFRSSIGGDFTMTLPSGRRMVYEYVKCEARIIKGKDGKPQRKSEFTANTGDKRQAFYGGKLTANLISGTARDIFGEHMAAMDSAGLEICWNAHDEAILNVDDSVAPADIERFMSVTPDWCKGLPLAAEAKTVKCYCK